MEECTDKNNGMEDKISEVYLTRDEEIMIIVE